MGHFALGLSIITILVCKLAHTCYCNHLAKLSQKIVASQKKPAHHITIATIFVQKIVAIVM